MLNNSKMKVNKQRNLDCFVCFPILGIVGLLLQFFLIQDSLLHAAQSVTATRGTCRQQPKDPLSVSMALYGGITTSRRPGTER